MRTRKSKEAGTEKPKELGSRNSEEVKRVLKKKDTVNTIRRAVGAGCGTGGTVVEVSGKKNLLHLGQFVQRPQRLKLP